MTLLKLFEAFKTYCDLFWGFFILDVRQLYPTAVSAPAGFLSLCTAFRSAHFLVTSVFLVLRYWPFWEGGLLFPFHFCSLSVVEPSCAFVLSSIANRPLLCVWSRGCVSKGEISPTHRLHQMFPLPTSSHSCLQPIICGEFIKQFGYAFFHVISQIYVVVLLRICNSIIF